MLYDKNIDRKSINNDIFQNKTRSENLQNNEHSLLTNLNLLIHQIELKEKEKFECVQSINNFTDKVKLKLNQRKKIC